MDDLFGSWTFPTRQADSTVLPIPARPASVNSYGSPMQEVTWEQREYPYGPLMFPSRQADPMLFPLPESVDSNVSPLTLGPPADEDYPEERIVQRDLELHFSSYEYTDDLQGLIESFVSGMLPPRPETQQQIAVELFTLHYIPEDLTIEEQGDLGQVFEQYLRLHRLPVELVDFFYESLPEPIDLMSPDEYEPIPMEGLEDVVVERSSMFPWFDPTTIIVRNPARPLTPLHNPDIEGSAALREIHDLATDLSRIHSAFCDIHDQLSHMIVDMGAPDDPLRVGAQRLLHENADDLDLVLLPDPDDISMDDDLHTLAEGLANVERIFGIIKEKVFLAETYLVTQETLLLASGDKFKAYASRYERSRYRDFLRWLFANCKTARLRGVFIPTSQEPAPVSRAYDESEHRCPVCFEDLPEEGELTPPPAVSFTCCNKGFHVDCLLEWSFEKLDQGMPCPMCRKQFDLDFLGTLMEQKVRELQCL
jgi:hypothetical protein